MYLKQIAVFRNSVNKGLNGYAIVYLTNLIYILNVPREKNSILVTKF